MKRANVKIPVDVMARVDKAAKLRERSWAYIVEEIIDQHVEDHMEERK